MILKTKAARLAGAAQARRRTFGLALGLALGSALGLGLAATPGAAAQESLLRQALVGERAETKARYAVETGRRTFVLEPAGEGALMRFDGAFEVFALTASPGPRGDTIYRLDTGEEFVRLTGLGGATLFPRERREGVPATRLPTATAGVAAAPSRGLSAPPAFALPASDAPALARAVEDLSATFLEYGAGAVNVWVSPEGERHPAPMTDAVKVTEIGVTQTLRATARTAADIDAVKFEVGSGPAAKRQGVALIVVVDPHAGYFGRPSSFAVANAMTE